MWILKNRARTMLLLLVTADTQREYEKIRVQARIACGVGGGEQVWASFDQAEERRRRKSRRRKRRRILKSK